MNNQQFSDPALEQMLDLIGSDVEQTGKLPFSVGTSTPATDARAIPLVQALRALKTAAANVGLRPGEGFEKEIWIAVCIAADPQKQ